VSDPAEYVTTRKVGSETIRYYERGRGTPLVLIHGMFGDFLDWEPVLEPLALRHRVAAVDLPGFGGSTKPRREYTGEFFVATLHELLCQLGIGKAILVGNSFGGQVAMLYALAHPDAVEKLALVNSGGFKQYSEEEIAQVAPRFSEKVIAALTPEINAVLFGGVFTKPSETSARYLEKQNAKLRREDYPAYAYSIANSIRLSLATYLMDRLPELRCPTLLVWGEGDMVLPVAQAEAALARLPFGELKRIPGCGHAPQMECPAGFLKATEMFLASPTPEQA
jgi:2-hydroxy-6-oxonona-2,4-dienedioate hydrolase